MGHFLAGAGPQTHCPHQFAYSKDKEQKERISGRLVNFKQHNQAGLSNTKKQKNLKN